MHENRILELLTRKIVGKATSHELGELSYLLTKCQDAVHYEALLEQVWNLGQVGIKDNLDEAFRKHKLRNQDDLDFDTKGNGFYVFFKKHALILAAVTLIVFSTGLYFSGYYHSSNKLVRTDIYAGKRIRKEVKLKDGTMVRLNSDSKLSYDPDTQWQIQRDVSLKSLYDFSRLQWQVIFKNASPQWYCTYSPTKLLRAEAILRGWATGDAAVHYSNSVRADLQRMAEFGTQAAITAATITAYVAANFLVTAIALKMIDEQYWVVYIPNGFKALANFRLTGYPNLPANPFTASEIPGEFIRLSVYPESEQIANKENYAE